MEKMTIILKPDKENLEKAAKILEVGGTLIMPSENGYIFACDYTNKGALEELSLIARAKSPIVAIVNGFEMAKAYGKTEKVDEVFTKRFMPGKMAIVVPGKRKNDFPFCFAISIDSNVRAIMRSLKKPIAAMPVMNLDGDQIKNADGLQNFFGRVNLILENGTLPDPERPTIVSLQPEFKVYQEGAISKMNLAMFIKELEKRI